MPAESYGYRGLDLALLDHLPAGPGFYIEAGAYDGVTQSNTALLEFRHGWQGILIEPQPDFAAECRRRRPASTVVEAALVPPDHTAPTVRMRTAGLMSAVAGARGGEDADQEYADLAVVLDGVQTGVLDAPARTLTRILRDHSVGRVDLLCLDVEGYEPQVLRGIDPDGVRPRLILTEVWDRRAVEAALPPGYERVASLGSWHVAGLRWEDALYRDRHADPF